MVKEAEANAEADKRERERVEVRNEGDSMIYSTEKSLKELGDKIPDAEKQKIEDAVAELKQALSGDNNDLIREKTEALKQASYKIAEELYKTQQGAAGGADMGGAGPDMNGGAAGPDSGAASGTTKGTADDVDYEVVDDDK